MTGAELVSEAIGYYDNTLPTDATNTNRRLRVLHSAQMVLEEVYNFRPWAFKHASASVTTTAGAATLPTSPRFARLGPEGMVRDSTGGVWTETTQQEIDAIRASGTDIQRKLFAIGSESGPTGGYQLLVPDTTTSYVLTVHYDSAAPTLADSTAAITAIPNQYHRTVLLAGTIARMQTAKSDIRAFWLQQYALGLARMAANEMPLQSRVQQLPMFQRGQW